MLNSLTPFLIQWAVTALSLWVASYLFKGLRFEGTGSLVVAALVLGFANALVKPLLIVLTFRAYQDLGTDDTDAMRAAEPVDTPLPPEGY